MISTKIDNQIDNQITEQLLSIRQKKFTGRVEISSLNNTQTWYLYLCLGRLIWADGGCHPHRSWQRYLLNCDFRIDEILSSEKNKIAEIECGNYYFLHLLIDRGLMDKIQAINIIRDKIVEVLFDIFQQEQKGTLKYIYRDENLEFLLKKGLNISTTLLSVEQALVKAKKNWLVWNQSALKNYSPNLAPVIVESRLVQKQLPAVFYQKFTRIFRGELSLRDLAAYMNKDLVSFSSSLSRYIQEKSLELVTIPDLQPFTPLPPLQQNKTKRSLIACIDDSPQICQIMSQILTKANYESFSIQNPLEAIPQLIKFTPSLIFLDLTMPIVNGYELCAQIKRVSKLKDIPVVILTSSDQVINRVRAKLVSASAFLAKPIREDQVIKTIKKITEKTAS